MSRILSRIQNQNELLIVFIIAIFLFAVSVSVYSPHFSSCSSILASAAIEYMHVTQAYTSMATIPSNSNASVWSRPRK